MTPLTNYLESQPPGYAVLLNGPWGVGKSFAWQRYVRDTLPGIGLTPVTISVAGLQSTDDLERALFQASIGEHAPALLTEAGTVIGRAALRWLKIEPDDIQLKADMCGGKTVVCIDDLERFAGSFSVLFGFIVSLIDATGVHCVLIADEDRASACFQEYGTYKERIVGRTISVHPELAAFYHQITLGFADQRIRTTLEAHSEMAIALLNERGVANLRTVRFLLTEIESLVKRLPQQQRPLQIQNLFNAMTFWALAVAKDARNARLVARAFSTQDLGIAIAMHEAGHAENAEGQNETELGLLLGLLDSTGFTNDAYNWPQSEAFNAFVQEKEVDYHALASDFSVALEQGHEDSDPLKKVQHYRSLSDAQLAEQIGLLRAEMDQKESESAARVFEMYRTIYWMAKRGLAGASPDEITAWAIEVVRNYPLERLTDADVEYWMGPYDDLEQTVIDEVTLLTERFNSHQRENTRQQALEYLISGRGNTPEVVGAPLFTEADAVAVFDEIRANGVSAIGRFLTFFRARLRVGNSADYVGDDAVFAATLAATIRQRVQPVALMSIVDSECLELADGLERFAQYVANSR